MSSIDANGVINQDYIGRKADYLFRISMKAVITNSKGEVLTVKETGRTWWDLPGGGMDHDEDIKSALARELYEEVGMMSDFHYRVIAAEDPMYLINAKVWQVRLIFAVTPNDMNFTAGEDADEIAFINPKQFRDAEHSAEKMIYKYTSAAAI
jgi:ADP-ribose pyrophosphatase YjhB (NUDIX family)